MRIGVDLRRCQGNGRCVEAAPGVFEVEGGRTVRLLQDEPDDALRPAVERAARRCPTQAISVERTETPR